MDKYIGLDVHATSCTAANGAFAQRSRSTRPTSRNRRRASVGFLDEASVDDGPKSPRVSYAPPESRTKPWPVEALIARKVSGLKGLFF